MPIYEYRCVNGHVTELVLPMADDKPESVPCGYEKTPAEASADGGLSDYERRERDGELTLGCVLTAARVFLSPIAVHWDGKGGSYYEDSYRNDSGRYGWKRRANAADDLPVAGL